MAESFEKNEVLRNETATLDLLPQVDFRFNSGQPQKYLLVEVTLSDGSKKVFLRADPYAKLHKHILQEFKTEAKEVFGEDVLVKPLGGGRIQQKDNKLHCFDQSKDFGPADHDMLERLTPEMLKVSQCDEIDYSQPKN